MGKIVQKTGKKGSLKWIQCVVNESPQFLDEPVGRHTGLSGNDSVEWLSPLKNDSYAEYRDQAFLDLLNIELPNRRLEDFWPRQGPQWDALGRIEDKAYLLVEAKAHVSEIISSSQAKSPKSISRINRSLNEMKKYLKLKPHLDLSKGFYQYSNRLAHLYLLRKLNGIPVYLVFVYFVNDHTYIPTTRDEWNGTLQLMHSLLGTGRHRLKRYTIDVFIDVGDL